MKNELLIPSLLWPLLTLICLLLVLAGLHVAMKRAGWEKNSRRKIIFITSLLLAIWSTILVILSLRGFFADFSHLPPRPAIIILLPLPFVLGFAFSKKGTALLRSLPPQALVWMQSFRIAVELLLLLAFMHGKLPVQMTFEGRNFDMVTGVLALPAGYLLARKKRYAPKLAIAFNVIGLLLLLNILLIAVLSMPTPFRYFMNEPSNTLVAQFPFILLPGVLVPLAYSLHILSLRQLLAKRIDK